MVGTCGYIPWIASILSIKYKQGHLLVIKMEGKWWCFNLLVFLFVLGLALNILCLRKDIY